MGVSLKFLFGAWKAFFLNPQVLMTLWWLLAIGAALRLLFLFFDDLATFMRGGHSVLGEIFGRESGKALGTFFKDMTALVESLMGPMSMLGAAVWDLGEALLQLVGIDLMPLKDLGDWFERELSEAALGVKIMTAQLEKGMTPLTDTELFSIQRAHDKERNASLSPEYHERARQREQERLGALASKRYTEGTDRARNLRQPEGRFGGRGHVSRWRARQRRVRRPHAWLAGPYRPRRTRPHNAAGCRPPGGRGWR